MSFSTERRKADGDWQGSMLGPVVVLYGGKSAEREISLQTGKAIVEALKHLNISAVAVDTRDNNWIDDVINNYKHAFIALHGTGGEDGRIQGLLDYAGISYTGSGVMASALAMDKVRTKLLWKGLGLPTPDFKLLEKLEDCTDFVEAWGKAIVKPVHEGSSIGMSIVSSLKELKIAYVEALQYDDAIMAEEYVTGPEYTVAILGDQVFPAIRLETDRSFYDYEAKYSSNSTRYFTSCGLDSKKEQELTQLAMDAYKSLGCSGWGRVDIMQNEQQEFLLLEVNTVPGMTDHSLVPIAAKAAGMDFDELVGEILRLSIVEPGL